MPEIISAKGVEVWTPQGWQTFEGIVHKGTRPVIRIETEGGRWIECTKEHPLFDGEGNRIDAGLLRSGSLIQSDEDAVRITSVTLIGEMPVYDLIEVGGGHRFYANGILSSNCSFLSGDATLISPQCLASLKHGVRDPQFVDRFGVRWYEKVFPNTAYAVTLDPSEGVGLDDSCIQVWELPELKQVAEWNSNKLDQVEQTRMLRRILKRIEKMQNADPEHNGQSNVYFSVERNGQGVGIINAIMYEGEDTFPGFFTHGSTSSIHVKGASVKRDPIHKWNGLWTSPASKKRFALEFKSLIERNIFTPRSSRLVSQLKTFVRSGSYGWTAKEGSKDDVVMSCILMCHLIEELRYQEPELDDMIRPDVLEDYYDPNNPAFNPLLPSLN